MNYPPLKSWIKNLMLFLAINLITFVVFAPFIVFYGPFESVKAIAVGSILTSRHPQVLDFFLSKNEVAQIINQSQTANLPAAANIFAGIDTEQEFYDPVNGIVVENITGETFKGKVMIIEDPKQVQVAVTCKMGVAGQRLTELVAESNAIAGINGGGFYDPNGKGNGAYPDGLTVHNGMIIHDNTGNRKVNVIGIDYNGKLVLGLMTANDIEKYNIKEAVSFGPNLIVNGEPQISGDGGWGIAPRTGIGQRADGSIILVVIDGRQPTWSIGATLRDLMHVFYQYGAINAANLDGGSSSEMVYSGKILNKLWNIFGERYIPTAFVVMPR